MSFPSPAKILTGVLDPIGIFTGGNKTAPSPPPPAAAPPPAANDTAVEAARRAELTAAAKARGRAATLLTSGSGDVSTPNIGRTTLLGGP